MQQLEEVLAWFWLWMKWLPRKSTKAKQLATGKGAE
jgi:hypothetical protein